MPYEYWCRQCEAVSPERRDRQDDAQDELVEHRRTAHGGLAPTAGDGVRRVHDETRHGCSGSLLFIAFLIFAVLANCWGR
ncbi:hypothetical protein ACFCWT_13465 [Streptomyces olivaceus]|uniref:hypothetical protein n=1 Tax=Streptomyces olivaceus TaxID=47716 RepID=UPI0035E0B3A2